MKALKLFSIFLASIVFFSAIIFAIPIILSFFFDVLHYLSNLSDQYSLYIENSLSITNEAADFVTGASLFFAVIFTAAFAFVCCMHVFYPDE